MQLVLQVTARVKVSQKLLKDLLPVHQKQDLSLVIVSTFLINQSNNLLLKFVSGLGVSVILEWNN